MNEILATLLALLAKSQEIAKYAQHIPAALNTAQELYKLVLRVIKIMKENKLLTPAGAAELDAKIDAMIDAPWNQIKPDPGSEHLPPIPPLPKDR